MTEREFPCRISTGTTPLPRRSVGADRAIAIDEGLRAYMIRVYNYMAMGVALTGVVSWLTFQRGRDGIGVDSLVLTPFGQMIFSGPAVLVLFLGTLGLVFLISWRINSLAPSTAFTLFMVYAGLLGLMLSSVFLTYTGASITRVFFISAASFGALSLYGYTTQRDLSAIGSFLVMGLIGLIIAMPGQPVPQEHRARLRDLRRRRADLRRSHRLGHAAHQGNVRPDGGRHHRRPQGRDGRAVALSRLHQPVPVHAALPRRSPLSLSALGLL